ncbi:MAG: DUF1572 family protein [Sphingobacteriia bacterium]|jgi:uncharacterized damage-inducible protein DinB
MIKNTLISLFERDLNRVINELNQYQSALNIWKIESNISNSAGNLVLHLIGNLNTYIGKEIGHTDYVRNRELEFSQKNVSKEVLIDQLTQTIEVIKKSLVVLTEEDFNKEYPVLVFSETTTTEYLLIHLTTHLAYHLGQINYHRRFIEK